MKPGPRNGFYRTLLEGKYNGEPPEVTASLRKKNPREYSRRTMCRALWRRLHNKKDLQKFGKRVRSIRRQMKKSIAEFAKIVGVSRVTIVRWERGLGHMPSTWTTKNKHGKKVPSNMQRIEELEQLCAQMKESGTEFEEE